jgi:hypothetical protein|tara:strand:+ start:183 stop:971 length:789 start_codon:yes stop_codon:yes gene_type:complete
MRPILISSIVFGFAISYLRFSGTKDISVALPVFLLGILISYLFIIFVYRILSRFLFYADAEIIKTDNPTNYFFIIAMAFLSNGQFLFLDLMNFDLKFKRKYKPFWRSGWRAGFGYETYYRSAILVFLVALSAVVSIIHSASGGIVTEYLLTLLIWNMISGVIPIAGLFSTLLMIPGGLGLPGGSKILTQTRKFVPESGGTKMFFSNRRLWGFFGPFVGFWSFGLAIGANLFYNFILSLLIGSAVLLILLAFWDFKIKKNVAG